MAATKNLAKHDRGNHSWDLGVRAVWRGLFRKAMGFASLVGLEVIQREAVCAAGALVFCATVVVPSILIFSDRSLPFQYIDASVVEPSVSPGSRAHFRITVRRVKKTCGGHVERVFVDSTGHVFPLSTERSAYQYFPDQDGDHGIRVIERGFIVPDEAAAGEGTIAAFPEFWCYPLQFLYPVVAPSQRAKVNVVGVPKRG